jgi:predicted O-linked N-acetylglucosamine transferase (SPINDLY family)
MAELLERHDRTRFEVYVYSHGREDDSPIHDRIVAAADHLVRTEDMSPQETAAKVHGDGIDILIDLKGYTQDARPLVFAYRPAPVQAAYLGFPGTSGADWMDYIVGDPKVTPLEHAGHFSEKIAQLPGCYQCNDGTRRLPVASTRASHGLPEDALVLCGFNQAYKISPEVFDVWCRLLLRLPQSVLWLHSWNQQSPSALVREARARGIDPARLVFAPTLHQRAHLDRLPNADIFLDTWPCNGHTTASDMLWAGVPVVTYSGKTFASRVAGSLLHAVGVPDTICDSVEAYEAKVMELATHESIRCDIRRRIEQARHTSPLFSGERIARDIEALYERMWERALAGLPPEHLPALEHDPSDRTAFLART